MVYTWPTHQLRHHLAPHRAWEIHQVCPKGRKLVQVQVTKPTLSLSRIHAVLHTVEWNQNLIPALHVEVEKTVAEVLRRAPDRLIWELRWCLECTPKKWPEHTLDLYIRSLLSRQSEKDYGLTAESMRIYKPMGGFSAQIGGKIAVPSANVMNFLATEVMKSDWYFPFGGWDRFH